MKTGTVAIFVAKLTFMAGGYALYMSLSRILSTEQFGVYGVVFGVVSVINMVLINGTLQTVSRFTATSAGGERAVRRRVFGYQAMLAAVILGSFWLVAPWLGVLLNDTRLVPLFRLSVLITGVYAFYAVNVGALNGRKLFVRQAALDISFSVLKVSLIVAAVLVWGGIESVILGFAAAAAVVMGASFVLAHGGGREESSLSLPAFLRFAASVMVVAFILNLLLTADLFFLKRLSPANLADSLAGFYTAAQSVARIPFYLTVTASLVLFPMIASLGEAARDKERREVSSRGLSAVIGLLAGMPALTVPIADRVILVLYPAQYVEAAPPFQWLVVSCCLLAAVNVCVTMISGAGRPGTSAAILFTGLALQAIGCSLLIPALGIGGAAVATASAATVTLMVAGVALYRLLGTRITRRVLVVVAGASAAVAVLSSGFARWMSDAGLVATVAFLAVGYGLYLFLLLLGGVLMGDGGARDRVLLVTKPLEPPFNDASKVFPRALVGELDADGLAVLCTARGRNDPSWPEGLERIGAYSSSDGFVGRSAQNVRVFLVLLLTRLRYRALHFFFAPNRVTSLAVRILKLLTPGVPFIQTVMSRPRQMASAGPLLFGDIVVCASQATRDALAVVAPSRTLAVIRPGIDLGDVAVESNSAVDRGRVGRLRSRDLDPAAFHLLFAGDVEHGGALSHLRTIVPLVLADAPVHFHLSVRLKGARARATAQQFVDETLAAWPGRYSVYFDHEPFADLLDLQDAMVFPADDLIAKIDAPLVILETMARGKPVFALDRSPVGEIFTPDLRAQLLADDDEALAQRIVEHARDGSTVSAVVLRERIESEFSIEKSAAAYGELHAEARHAR